MLTSFFLLIATAMVAIHMVLLTGAVLSAYKERNLSAAAGEVDPERVSVIVPARNEEALLPRLLADLEAQDTEGFEVVLVNDRSEDRTAEIMEEFSRRFPGEVQIVTIDEEPHLANPKQRALAAGASAAGGDIFLMTDADCSISSSWVRVFSSYFYSDTVGLVFGTVIPGVKGLGRRAGLKDYYQSFDQIFRYQYTAASSGLGIPSGGFGNNIAIRRQALSDVGGFEGLKYSLTEDAQLISQVRDTRKWKIRAVQNPKLCVVPAPQRRLSEMVKQSTRWNAGGFFAPDIPSRLSYGIFMLYLCASVFLLPVSLFFPAAGLPSAASLLSMGIIGAAAGVLNKPGPWYWALLLPHVVFSLFYYSFITILTLLKTPVSWKGLILPLKRS